MTLQEKREIIKENSETILKLCDEGFPINHIAKRFEISDWLVKKFICGLGRETREQRIKRIRKDELEELIKSYSKGLSVTAVAGKYSISRNAARKTLLDSGIGIRTLKEIGEMRRKERIFPFLNQGLSSGEIHRRTGSYSKTIRRTALENGLQVKRKSAEEIKRILGKFENEILSLYEEKKEKTTLGYLGEKTGLVPWHIAKILERNGKKWKKRKFFQDVCFTQEENAIILGSLLGDANISGLNRTRRISWSYSNQAYAKFIFSKVKRLCNSPLREEILWACYPCQKYLRKKHLFCPKCGKRMRKQVHWLFQTKSLLSFKEMDNYVRKEKNNHRLKKTISKDWLKRLTPLSLAVWYMDDGFLNRGTSMWLCTDGFSYLEHKIIQNYFREIWQIDTHIRKANGYFRLRMDIDSNEDFARLIKSFFPVCMEYKLPKSLSPLVCDCCGKQFTVPRRKYKYNLNCCFEPQCRKLKKRYRNKSKNTVPLDFKNWCSEIRKKGGWDENMAIK